MSMVNWIIPVSPILPLLPRLSSNRLQVIRPRMVGLVACHTLATTDTGNALVGEILKIHMLFCMFNGHADKVPISIKFDQDILVDITRLNNVPMRKMDQQSIRVRKILQFHGQSSRLPARCIGIGCGSIVCSWVGLLRNGGEHGSSYTLGDAECLLCSLSVWPELKVIAQLHGIGRQFYKIDVRER